VALTIRYFAWVRELCGADEELAELPSGIATIAHLIGWQVARGGGYAEAFADPARLRFAMDMEMVGLNAPITNAKEIAFFPPVTGG
jgi:sulfur-carrier protein